VAAVVDLHGFKLRFGDAQPGAIVEILCGDSVATTRDERLS